MEENLSKVCLSVSVRKSAKSLLVSRAKATGRSTSELTEFAIINMPFIPAKNFKSNLIRGDSK